MSAFPRIHDDATCPLDGYEGYVFRVLVNPTGAEKQDWSLGSLGVDGCQDCAALDEGVYCDSCQALRARMGRASVAIFGESRVAGFDFSTPDAALASFEQPGLPDDLLLWLYMLPVELWSARVEDMRKKLPFSSRTGS